MTLSALIFAIAAFLILVAIGTIVDRWHARRAWKRAGQDAARLLRRDP